MPSMRNMPRRKTQRLSRRCPNKPQLPCRRTYRGDHMIIFTKEELWVSQAPNLNFELDQDALLKRALKRGFVRKVGDDQYQVNESYPSPEEEQK
jgi:hypothetical protein